MINDTTKEIESITQIEYYNKINIIPNMDCVEESNGNTEPPKSSSSD